MTKQLDTSYYENPELEIYNIKKSCGFFHNRRFNICHKLVKKYWKGGAILDLCCGLCEWNKDNLKVDGLDASRELLEIAKKSGRIKKLINSNVLENKLPKNSYSLIVCTETLEHFSHPEIVIAEIYRLLKKDGIVILSVPYDTFFSLWKPMFFVRCFIEGRIKGKTYYKNGAGHVTKFSPRKLVSLLGDFKVLEIVNNLRLNFFVVAQKKS